MVTFISPPDGEPISEIEVHLERHSVTGLRRFYAGDTMAFTIDPKR